MSVPGGIGAKQQPDSNVHEICEKVRKEVEDKSGQQFPEFTAIEYKTQLVNGVNYFIKVRISDGKYLHLRSHKTFSGEISFSGFEDNKSLEEEISYFQ